MEKICSEIVEGIQYHEENLRKKYQEIDANARQRKSIAMSRKQGYSY